MKARRFLYALSMLMLIIIVGCSTNNGSNGADSQQGSNQDNNVPVVTEKTEVEFWYLWGGTEGENLERLISEFNSSQDLYQVNGLSVPDVQKIIVSISSGEGPDITGNFSNNTASYADMGMMQSLDEYIERDNYDISDFVPAALEGVTYEGKLYALPINVNFNMMFYNKELLAEAGYSAPPETAEELLEMAINTTKLNDDNTIDTLGFPDFPVVYYPNNMTYSFGGDFISSDGQTLTPDNDGMIKAIKLMQDYRDEFGMENVIRFNSSAKYLDAMDPFIIGKQALRIDGPWFGNTVKNVLEIDLDYGVAPLPGGGGEVSSSTMFIPSNARNKEGAWAFLSWLMDKESMTKFSEMFANLPSRTSVYDDPRLQDIPDFQAFAEAVTSPNLKSFPVFASQAEYGKIITDEFELAVNGRKSAEEAVQAMKDQASGLLE